MKTSVIGAWPHAPLLLRAVVLAAAYAVVAGCGYSFAPSPGFTSAVWPASGLALAFAVSLGRGALTGIWLGAFCAALWGFVRLDAVDVSLPLRCVLSAGLALAAVVPAALGAAVIRRKLELRDLLCDERETLAFLLLICPFISVVYATLVVGSLFACSVIPPDEIVYHWLLAAAGSALGNIVVTPITLLFLGHSQREWRRCRRAVTSALAIAYVGTIALYLQASSWDEERAKNRQQHHAIDAKNSFLAKLESGREILHAIASFYAGSKSVEESEFKAFVHHFLARDSVTHTLAWVPRVLAAERDEFEAQVRAENRLDFQIKDWTGTKWVPSAIRAVHSPVLFAEPHRQNEEVVGFDLAGCPRMRSAFDLSCDSGSIVTSYTVPEVGGPNGSLDFGLALPIYANGAPHSTPEARRRSLVGHLLGMIRVKDACWPAAERLAAAGLSLSIREHAEHGQDEIFFSNAGNDDEDDTSSLAPSDLRFTVYGREWTLSVDSAKELLARERTWHPWAVLGGGFAFTVELCLLVLSLTGRTRRVEGTRFGTVPWTYHERTRTFRLKSPYASERNGDWRRRNMQPNPEAERRVRSSPT